MRFNSILDKFILKGDHYECVDISKNEMGMIRLALKTQDAIDDVLDDEIKNPNSKNYVLVAWRQYENQEIKDTLGYFYSEKRAEKVRDEYIEEGFNYFEYQIQKI